MSEPEDVIEPARRIPDGRGRELCIGIVGCGGIVQYGHLPAYRQGGLHVRAVYDLDPERARAMADEFGIPVVASSAEELVAMPGVDIVDIAVPPWVQPEIVGLATAAGRHYPDGRPDTLTLHRTAEDPRSFDFDTRWIPDAFLGPMTDLMDAVATGRSPVTSGRDNLGTLALVFGAYRSAAERRSIRVEDVLLSG